MRRAAILAGAPRCFYVAGEADTGNRTGCRLEGRAPAACEGDHTAGRKSSVSLMERVVRLTCCAAGEIFDSMIVRGKNLL